MDVILHVGAHRTASTSLQRLLAGNPQALADAGLRYWGPRRARGGLFDGLIEDPCAGLPDLAARQRRGTARVRLQLEQARQSGAQALLVSEENMLGSLRENLRDRVLYPQARDRLARLAPAFGDTCTGIALGVRSLDAYWASVIAFRLPRGGPAPTPDLCDALLRQPRRWRDVVRDLAAVFPGAPIVVWSLEATPPGAALAACLARPPFLPPSTLHHNAAPEPATLRGVLADRGEDPTLIRGHRGRFMPFNRGQRAVLRADYAQDLAWLRAGADGLATFIDAPAQDRDAKGQGRGPENDRENRRMA